MASIGERFKRSWKAFTSRDPTSYEDYTSSKGEPVYTSGSRPDRVRLTTNGIRSIVGGIYNQIAVDCSLIDIRHVRLDEDGRFSEIIDDSLNYCLTLDPNIDQTGRGLIRDIVMSMFDEGCVAIVPIETDVDPNINQTFQIRKLRVGKILEWSPLSIRIRIYDEIHGYYVERWVEKRVVTIVENPFYSIMNEPNSHVKRLLRILSQIDKTNDMASSEKLDMIIQLPYSLKTEAKKELAEKRRKDLEDQLVNSKLGIGYIDATERVIQLNRSLENNLWIQAMDLLSQIYNQLGFSQSIFDGTADEKTMLNYNNRTIEPIMSEITEQMQKKWISRTALTQKQAIRFYKDPFKLVPVNQLAEIADKFTRNEIMTTNEIRSEIGMKPSKDPKADELRNANLNHPDEKTEINVNEKIEEKEE